MEVFLKIVIYVFWGAEHKSHFYTSKILYFPNKFQNKMARYLKNGRVILTTLILFTGIFGAE